MSKSDESLELARDIQNKGHPDFSVSRAYYAMFYAAEALLLSKRMQFAKHSSVIGAFNKEFVRPGLFPNEMTRALQKAFDFRMQGDYSIEPVPSDAAEAVIEAAARFIGRIREYLVKEGFLTAHDTEAE
ncbi:MAG: HEPN domain-containing protein [bacterium]